jgi:WD40 repeat protein
VKNVSRGIVASIDSGGHPHISVKNGRLRNDGTLELWNVFGEETLRNIEGNSKVCVAFVDFEKAWGYRFMGSGSVETSGDRFEKVR